MIYHNHHCEAVDCMALRLCAGSLVGQQVPKCSSSRCQLNVYLFPSHVHHFALFDHPDQVGFDLHERWPFLCQLLPAHLHQIVNVSRTVFRLF